MDKKTARSRRALRTRSHIKKLDVVRLCVHRTPRHIYAQLIAASGDKVIVCASTLDAEIKAKGIKSGNVAAAVAVGDLIGKRALQAGYSKIAFDRSGYKYHGRIKALADAARETGLDF